MSPEGVGAAGLFEAEIELETIEPRDFWADPLLRQFFRQVFIVLAQQRGVGRIIERDHNRLVFDANIAFQALEEMARQMGGIPLGER
jgi:hypothetical protein